MDIRKLEYHYHAAPLTLSQAVDAAFHHGLELSEKTILNWARRNGHAKKSAIDRKWYIEFAPFIKNLLIIPEKKKARTKAQMEKLRRNRERKQKKRARKNLKCREQREAEKLYRARRDSKRKAAEEVGIERINKLWLDAFESRLLRDN